MGDVQAPDAVQNFLSDRQCAFAGGIRQDHDKFFTAVTADQIGRPMKGVKPALRKASGDQDYVVRVAALAALRRVLLSEAEPELGVRGPRY